MKRAWANLLLLLTAAAIVGVWLVVVWANYYGLLPKWAMWLVAAVLVGAFAFVGRALSRAVAGVDVLAPWREFRIVRNLEVHANGTDGVSLMLQLARPHELDKTAATLRFLGVTRLVVRQFGGEPVYFDGLRCIDLGPGRRDGKRFALRDEWYEMLAFRCRSFAEVSAGELMSKAHDVGDARQETGAPSSWRLGNGGREEMLYEELVDGRWEALSLEATGSVWAGVVIHIPSESEWTRYPSWAQGRRAEIVQRIKAACPQPGFSFDDE